MTSLIMISESNIDLLLLTSNVCFGEVRVVPLLRELHICSSLNHQQIPRLCIPELQHILKLCFKDHVAETGVKISQSLGTQLGPATANLLAHDGSSLPKHRAPEAGRFKHHYALKLCLERRAA